MSKLTTDEVKHVAKLAKLKLTPSEIKKFQEQLSSVVNYFDELNEVDTKKVEPTSQTTGLTDIFREDKIAVTNILTPEEALLNAKKTYNNYFVVPAILNKNDK